MANYMVVPNGLGDAPRGTLYWVWSSPAGAPMSFRTRKEALEMGQRLRARVDAPGGKTIADWSKGWESPGRLEGLSGELSILFLKHLVPGERLSLTKRQLNRDGYDRRGRYYGQGNALYCTQNEHGDETCVRALSYAEAKRAFPAGTRFTR